MHNKYVNNNRKGDHAVPEKTYSLIVIVVYSGVEVVPMQIQIYQI